LCVSPQGQRVTSRAASQFAKSDRHFCRSTHVEVNLTGQAGVPVLQKELRSKPSHYQLNQSNYWKMVLFAREDALSPGRTMVILVPGTKSVVDARRGKEKHEFDGRNFVGYSDGGYTVL
jgi:hypothetical protein